MPLRQKKKQLLLNEVTMIEFEDFMKADIRAGEIIKAELFESARKPAYKLWADFGEEIGIKKSSAQLTENYTPESLTGRQILGVVNFRPKQIAGFMSEVLILGIYSDQGVVLIEPEQRVKNGDKAG